MFPRSKGPFKKHAKKFANFPLSSVDEKPQRDLNKEGMDESQPERTKLYLTLSPRFE